MGLVLRAGEWLFGTSAVAECQSGAPPVAPFDEVYMSKLNRVTVDIREPRSRALAPGTCQSLRGSLMILDETLSNTTITFLADCKSEVDVGR